MTPSTTICVLTYGDYFSLAQRCLDSILKYCCRAEYRLVVGANAVSPETLRWLEELHATGVIDTLHHSSENLGKCPMMRRMFADVDTDYICWFDDDSYVLEPNALSERLRLANLAPSSTVMWGHEFYFSEESNFSTNADVGSFVESSPWYRGLTPPSWIPGGKGEWNFEGRGVGDGRWFFITGGCWLIRTAAIRELDWPDKRLADNCPIKRADDVILGEAIRQQGWRVTDIGPCGVKINDAPRRGTG